MWYALTAFCTGILSGLAVGGGSMLLLLLLLIFRIPQHRAQGAVLAAFMATALVAAVTHWRQGNVNLRLALWLALGSVTGAVAGSLAAAALPAGTLRRIYALYLIGMGLANLTGLVQGEPAAERPTTGGPWGKA